MFERNILTFSPGWDQNAQKVAVDPDGNSILVDQHV